MTFTIINGIILPMQIFAQVVAAVAVVIFIAGALLRSKKLLGWSSGILVVTFAVTLLVGE